MPVIETPAVDNWLLDASAAGRVGLWKLDLASGSIECTPGCKINLGFPPDSELHVDDVFRAMHPDDREVTGTIVQKAVEARGEYHLLYRVVWPDGSIHWIDSRGRVGDGSIAGTTIDVTEQRQLEQQLSRESSRTRMITTHVAEALFFMDSGGHITFMNPAAEQTFGWTSQEVRGRVLHDIVHYKHPDGSPFPMADCPLGRTLADGVTLRNHEDLWIHKSGRFVPVICSSTPIIDSDIVRGAVVSAHDNTERKAIEDALRESSRAKDDFLATVSHELRTPMTAILGWTGFLRMIGVPEDLRTAIEQIDASAKAQASIVDDLIDVSRIVTGKLSLHLEDVEVEEVLDDAIRTIRPTADAKQITLTCQSTCEGARVHADRSRFRQVLWNLLTNAIKFTPERGAVTVNARLDDESVVMSVRDTGVGIAPEFLPRVFERFSQESSSARYQSGLGLGLSIVRQLVEMHGGRVSAESDGPGMGATFTVTLPRADRAAYPPAHSRP
ncbi:MAG TPA: ATP-binding protein [Thermoanaerobaculia bacterium]